MTTRHRFTGSEELIQVGADWYVHAASALADDRARVLKHGETFAIFDRYGDIQPIGLGEQGVYHRGTRHLSHLELRVAHKRPLLLSSNVSDENDLLTVDLANPEFEGDDGQLVPAETVHLLRSMFLWDNVFHERIDIRNYASRPVRFTLGHRFEADFRDIFEVRGHRRAVRGRVLPPRPTEGGVVLAYEGRDSIRRHTEITWSAPPSSEGGSSVEFLVELAPWEERSICVRFACSNGAPPSAAEYDEAFHAAQRARRESLAGMCHVETSNDDFNAWLSRSRADLMMLLTETDAGPYPYAGIPWFSTAFGRDGIITALEALWLQPDLAKGVLRYLARTQATEVDVFRDAEPGNILHETREGELANLGEIPFARYYGSVDGTPLFVVLAGAYYQATGDGQLIEEIWPAIRRALTWMDEFGDVDGDGFIEYTPSPHALVNQGWKDSNDSICHADGTLARGSIALCEVQAYTYAARLAAARLAVALGDAALAARLREQAADLERRFDETYWVEALGSYAIALDGDKRICATRSSNAGHCLFAGIVPPERAQRLAETLMDDTSFSGWGVRTVPSTEWHYNPMSYHNGSVWPHDNALIADGLSRYGRKQDAVALLDGLFAASEHLDLHRLPELLCGFPRRPGAGPTLYPVAASPQAWASGAVFMLLRACLGMTVDGVNRQVRFDRPQLPPYLGLVRIRDLRVGDVYLDLDINRHPEDVEVVVRRRTGDAQVLVVK